VGFLKRDMDTKAVLQEAMIYCAGKDLMDLCPKAEPQEQRGAYLIYPCKVTETKRKV
jgi:hypothetical protein